MIIPFRMRFSIICILYHQGQYAHVLLVYLILTIPGKEKIQIGNHAMVLYPMCTEETCFYVIQAID